MDLLLETLGGSGIRYRASPSLDPDEPGHQLHELFYCAEQHRLIMPSETVVEFETYYCPATLEVVADVPPYISPYAAACPRCKTTAEKNQVERQWHWHCAPCAWKSPLGAPSAEELKPSHSRVAHGVEGLIVTLKPVQQVAISKIQEDFPWRWTDCEAKLLASARRANSRQAQSWSELVLDARGLEQDPLPIPLRGLATVRCASCYAQGRPNLLLKPQSSPLKGDSHSSAKGEAGVWFKKKSLAWDWVPRFARGAGDKMSVTNPLQSAAELFMSGSSVVVGGAGDEEGNQVWLDKGLVTENQWNTVRVEHGKGGFEYQVHL